MKGYGEFVFRIFADPGEPLRIETANAACRRLPSSFLQTPKSLLEPRLRSLHSLFICVDLPRGRTVDTLAQIFVLQAHIACETARRAVARLRRRKNGHGREVKLSCAVFAHELS